MEKKIKADIKELIKLLGSRTYSTNTIVIRELIQNSYDSILNRYSSESSEVGKIEIHIKDDFNITIRDNGIGMSDKDLEGYLSVLGKSLKNNLNDQNKYIGEYGLGFFSAFMIAENINVYTRKVGENFAYSWNSKGVESYEIERIEDQLFPIGTQVTLTLSKSATEFSDVERLKRIILKYANFLDCNIYINDKLINNKRFPWEEKNNELARKALESHFGSSFHFFKYYHSRNLQLDCILILGDSNIGNQIYSKRIFVTKRIIDFIPKEVRFIGCLVNSNQLKLTLSREDIQTSTYYHSIINEINGYVWDWLNELFVKHKNNTLLLEIFSENEEYFKKVAIENVRLFDALYSLLKFELANFNHESISINRYFELNKLFESKIFYIEDELKERENLLLTVCEDQYIPVYLIRKQQSRELLRKIANKRKAELVNLFEEKDNILKKNQTKGLTNVLQIFNSFLNYNVDIKEYTPSSIPLLITDNNLLLNSNNTFLHQLNDFKLNSINRKTLYLEFFEIVKELTNVHFNNEKTLSRLLNKIFVIITSKANLMGNYEAVQADIDNIKNRWWEGPISFDLVKVKNVFTIANKHYHYRCFIVCSFKPKYKDVINTIKEIFEKYSIYAETAEEINNISIINKICLKIDECDLAVVDISENNPNVMLELGLLVARKKPAIIIKDKSLDDFHEIKIPSDIIGIERIEYQNTSEDLRQKLNDLCKKILKYA